MKYFIKSILAFVFFIVITACGQKTETTASPVAPTPVSGILTEMSGVWRAKGDGTMISIIYADSKVRLLFGEDSLPVSLGEVDDANKTANMNVILANGKPGVWTIRQLWDKQKTSFHLQLTLHDGTQDELAFVRKISTDDLNRIANAEARTKPGMVGSVVKSTEMAAQSTESSPQQVKSAVLTATPTASANIAKPATAPTPPLVVVAAGIPPTANESSPVSWAPSFDCAKVSNGSERLICSNKALSEADVKLAVAYRTAASASTNKESLRNTQNSWRKSERDACFEVQCMLSAYEKRITELSFK